MNTISRTALAALLILPLSTSVGCKTNGGTSTTIPRAEAISPPATATAARNFQAAKLEKLAVIIEGSPITTPTPPPSGYTWKGTLANGQWVSDSQINSQSATTARFVEDAFITTLLQKGYTVPTRSDLQAALQELNLFNKAGLTEADASQVGKLLKASAILIVSGIGGSEPFTYKNQSYARLNLRISARLIRVGQADILWIATKTFSGDIRKGSVDLDWVAGLFTEIASALPEHP